MLKYAWALLAIATRTKRGISSIIKRSTKNGQEKKQKSNSHSGNSPSKYHKPAIKAWRCALRRAIKLKQKPTKNIKDTKQEHGPLRTPGMET